MISDFFKIVANLKNIDRQGWIDKLSIDNPESVADHTYSMAVMSMVISDLEDYDSEKIIKMVLLHDLAESEIGDHTPEQIDKDEKRKLEDISFNKIIENLPKNIRTQYLQIWNEFQEGISEESIIVHQLDRLEMVLQAKIYQSRGIPYEKLETFLESAKKDITNPKLKELFTKMTQDM